MAQRFDILHRDVITLNPRRRVNTAREAANVLTGPTEMTVNVVHLVRLVEEQAEVGEDHPELLPAVAVLELPQ